ncbi:exosome complex component RRP43-like [Bolinopsis microptera]|uniref:exosome complex component RRP43-like n=1 Tax=Bolinopsis microptera TaxID=2820187 RepID=UPI00307A5996
MADDFKIAQPKQYQRLFLKDDIRPDGRALTGCREVKIHVNTVSSALGSAMVCCGNTRVIAGIKGRFAEPTINNPSSGYLVPNMILPMACNTKYKPGYPADSGVAMSNKLETLITDVTDLMELCVVPGKVVWCLNLDIVCINDDGNVLDAAVLALSAALNNCWLPATHVIEETGRVVVDPEGEKTKLELKFIPISVTLSVFDDQTLPDPSEDEEKIQCGSLTCCIDDQSKIRAMWSSANLADDVLSAALIYVKKRASVLLSVLQKVSKTS